MTEVILLAAGSLRNKINFIKFTYDCPALLPINTRSISSLIIDYYLSHNMKVHLVIEKKYLNEVKNELLYYLESINIICVENTSSAIETLDIALREIKSEIILVNLVTTVPTNIANENEVFLSKIKIKSKDVSFIDNNSFVYKSNNYFFGHAFTGIFSINRDLLVSSIGQVKYKSDLLYLIEFISNKKNLVFKQIEWIDCGHESNYFNAKNILISSRSFNAVFIEPYSGIITKTSKNIEKLKDEIKFVDMLPDDIKIFFPRILAKTTNSIQMEYYGYPTLAELMLHWKLDNLTIENIFIALTSVIQNFQKYRYSIGYDAYMKFYFEKTLNRVDDFYSQIEDKYSFLISHNKLIINNIGYSNFNKLKDRVKNKISSLYSEKDFNIMHGDFCFNNILFDVNTNIIRLIDARGSFGENCTGIYGDIKYDLAKLTHSIIGGYDYIVNNIFSLNISEKRFYYDIPYKENYDIFCALNKELIKEFKYQENDILFLVGLLFISMCPLHSDDPKRQIVMYIHGIKILNESLEENNNE